MENDEKQDNIDREAYATWFKEYGTDVLYDYKEDLHGEEDPVPEAYQSDYFNDNFCREDWFDDNYEEMFVKYLEELECEDIPDSFLQSAYAHYLDLWADDEVHEDEDKSEERVK